nr:hypothetical protein [Acidobacteriota bacterium]
VIMDAAWLSAIETKDYLFPHEWPAYAWFFNFLPTAIVAAAFIRARTAAPELRGLMAGALVLTLFFLATLPLVTMRYALAVQLQIPRVFWLVELVAFILIARWIGQSRPGAARMAAAGLIALSAVRGAAVLAEEQAPRLVRIDVTRDDWGQAMAWLRAQPVDVHVLADPGHAWRYESSVRVVAERDLFHEDVKDAAVAMYDRDLAMRVVERRALTHNFPDKTPAELLALAARYHLDYLVSDQRIDLPPVYANATFTIYRLAR